MCDNTSVPRIPFIDLTKEEEVEEYPVQPKQERYPPNIPLSCMPDYMMAIPNSPQSEEEENLVEQPVLEPIPAIPQPEPVLEPEAELKIISQQTCPNGNEYYAVQEGTKTWLFKRREIDLQACAAMCNNQNPLDLSTQLLSNYMKKAKEVGNRRIYFQLLSIINARMDKFQFEPFTDEQKKMIYEKRAQGLRIKDIALLMKTDQSRITTFLWSTRYSLPGFDNF